MKIYVANSTSKVAQALEVNCYYVINRNIVVCKRAEGIYLISGDSLKGTGNIVDRFEQNCKGLVYESITKLDIKQISLLQKRIRTKTKS